MSKSIGAGGIITRVILTLGLFAIVGFLEFTINSVSTLELGKLAGNQFANSDTAYLSTQLGFHFWRNIGVPGIAVLIVLCMIWWGPVKNLVAAAGTLAVACALVIAIDHRPAFAFAETTDRTEIVPVLPNESAFWIPDVGANKDSQVKFDSEEYLNANKVAVKRFEIPHQKLYGTSGKSWTSGWDLFVPTGRLIIVPRTPYSHEWVDSVDRGSSTNKEGFPCQSKEGLDMTMGVSIGTSVSENQAARFLYNFGVQQTALKQNQTREDPQVIFQSVYYGKSLAQVMQEYGRKKVQTLVCNEVMGRKFDDVNAQMVQIMDTVDKRAREYFDSVGITLSFIGWADTATFSPDVQLAVNRRYIAQQDAEAARVLQPFQDTIMAVAQSNALRDFVNKGTPLPTTVVGSSPDFMGLTNGLRISPIMRNPAVQAPVTSPAH